MVFESKLNVLLSELLNRMDVAWTGTTRCYYIIPRTRAFSKVRMISKMLRNMPRRVLSKSKNNNTGLTNVVVDLGVSENVS
jgi:hypothetical protein